MLNLQITLKTIVTIEVSSLFDSSLPAARSPSTSPPAARVTRVGRVGNRVKRFLCEKGIKNPCNMLSWLIFCQRHTTRTKGASSYSPARPKDLLRRIRCHVEGGQALDIVVNPESAFLAVAGHRVGLTGIGIPGLKHHIPH